MADRSGSPAVRNGARVAGNADDPNREGPDDEDASTSLVSPSWRNERRLLRTARVNLLLIGSDDDTREVLDDLRSDFHEPITAWSAGQRFALPANAQAGTLVLDDISALGLDDQRRLLDWLGATARCTQVVSISSRSLLPLVEAGAFLDSLYYRLNVVCIDLIGNSEPPARDQRLMWGTSLDTAVERGGAERE